MKQPKAHYSGSSKGTQHNCDKRDTHTTGTKTGRVRDQNASGPVMRRFWPEANEKSYQNRVKIVLVNAVKVGNQEVLQLMISVDNKELMRVPLVNYRAWQSDIPVPDLGEFRQNVKEIEARIGRSGTTVLVCPSGATRCGTYAAVDVILSRISKEKR
ncbi:hypothetical protein TELCIR_12675, partial [Teladorsagia circumcincta]